MTDQNQENDQILGLENAASGETAGENSLEKVFHLAAEKHSAARFLRLGGPKKFRGDIIAIVDENGLSLTPGYKMLIDSNIPEIEFILTNPYSEAFLNRMDEENKSNWEIWRVKEQVIEFAAGLIKASQQRLSRNLSEIKIAFHSTDLVWNLGIVDGYYVVVRAYYKSSSGHDDSISELHLRLNSTSRLAESLISYYNSVKHDPCTDFIHSEKELETIGEWPSLFKGNAVQNPSSTSNEWIEKSCYSKFGDKAEVAWLSYKDTEAPICNYFNPLKLSRRKQKDEPWKGQVSVIHRVDGVPATDLLWHIQQIGNKYPDIISKLRLVSGSIIYQAFRALEEFRKVGDQIEGIKKEFQPYPWAQQLECAVLEAGRFAVDNQRELAKCRDEAKKLGGVLEKHASCPFRDAHLKNRLISIDRNLLTNDYRMLYEWLKVAEPEEVFIRLRNATYDIDFETCFWKVSKWDDPLHIFWSNNLGFDNARELANNKSFMATWWHSPQLTSDETVMWMTLLCRSLREFSRRLWYDHTMPNTYQQRYGIEKRDHFLKLALVAAEKVDGFTTIKNLLDRFKQAGDTLWLHAKTGVPVEPVVAEFPNFINQDTGIEPSFGDSHPNNYSITYSALLETISDQEKINLRTPKSRKYQQNRRTTVTSRPNKAAQPENALIITATKVETQAVLKAFSSDIRQARQEIGNKIYYNLGSNNDTHTFLVQSEMGSGTPGGSLLTVRQAIHDFGPSAIIMCGIAYGLRPNKQKLGDILIAKQLEYFEPQKIDLRRGSLPRGDRTTCSELLLSRARSVEVEWANRAPDIHFGLVLSGEKLVNDPAFRDWLIEKEPEAIGGEMEGAGLYTAARDSKVDWILIKAICDWADGNKSDDAQPLAAANAAEFALNILRMGR